MKFVVLEVLWHDQLPVLSVDFHSNGRLATAGGDKIVRIWRFTADQIDNPTPIEYLATLNRHQGPVNVVRFSPDGERLASAGDDGNVILWKLSNLEPRKTIGDEDDSKEIWTMAQLLRGGGEGSDVYDLTWSPDSCFIASASIDHSIRVYDIAKGQCIHLQDHSHYVQGVTWSPTGRILVSQSSDRTCRVYQVDTRKPGGAVGSNLSLSLLSKIHRTSASVCATAQQSSQTIAASPSDPTTPSEFFLFQDESLASFFRRLTFSPDGNLLVTPAGQFRGATNHTVYVFAANQPTKPLYHLPGHKKAAIAVRFSPVLYELRQSKVSTETTSASTPLPVLVDLPYRMIFAVATQDTLVIYDTQQPEPITLISNLHCSSITDIAWSANGQYLVVSSRDGFCSVAQFEPEELGTVHSLPASLVKDVPAPLENDQPSQVLSPIKVEKVATDEKMGVESDAKRKEVQPDETKKQKRRIVPQLVSPM